jgi:hypothetical protein
MKRREMMMIATTNNFQVLKHDLSNGTKIKAWTRLGNSVHGGGFYGWLEGVITARDLRSGKNLYYEIDGKRWIPVWDITG